LRLAGDFARFYERNKKMYADKTKIEVWSNHGNYQEPKKKPKQEKIGSMIFEGYAQMKDVDRILEALDENIYKHDPVEYRITITAKNS
jgi:hypothetical protein